MRTIKLVYDDFTNKVEVLRHASRGIVIKEDKILLSYMKKYDLYLLPGGGKEGLETLSDACERELHEETGYLVETKELYLDIEEYFDNWCHINHYFICNLLDGKSQQNLTKEEKEAGLVPIFVNINEALEIFSKYEDYKYNNIHKYGMYQREYKAIKEYLRYTSILDTKSFLESYIPVCEQEKSDLEYMLYMYSKQGDELFYRDSLATHFSSSSWIVNKEHTKVLLNYHNIYKNWGWLGGHNDGDKDFLNVAIKEAKEESGLNNITPVLDNPISIEILPVTYHYKNGKFVSSHTHMNVTYLLEADEKEELKIKPDENSGLKWVLLDDVNLVVKEEAMKPIYMKLNNVVKTLKMGL